MKNRKLRINVMGSSATCWCVQERVWWRWKTIAPFLRSIDDARAVMAALNSQL